ncbi:MAG: DUF3500 domain-containing protein [Alphaproteobacteria bacterium]|nr:DUF3500 domain-containing protein [Alphaproteobacteria bacterium]
MRALSLFALLPLLSCNDKADDSGSVSYIDCSQTAGMADAVSTDATLVAAADAVNAFLASLDETQRTEVLYCLDDVELYSWTNIDIGDMPRTGGLSFGDLSEDQLAAAYAVFDAFLSTQGYEDVDNIINVIEPATAERYADNPNRVHGPQYYTIVVFGSPGTDPSWGVQLDGHHLAVNFLVHGDEVTITPAFSGADPKTVGSVSPFADEEAAAYALAQSLDAGQLATATIGTDLPEDLYTSNVGFSDTDDGRDFDVSAFEQEGLAASALDASQKDLLRALIDTYVGDMDDALAAAWNTRIEANLDVTRFSWVGDTADQSPVYYRVSSPVLVIEYAHSHGEIDHPHAMLRDPNTGTDTTTSDYGVFAHTDPLRAHLQNHPHHAADPQRANPMETLLVMATVRASAAASSL